MPIYEFICKNKHITEYFFPRYDLSLITDFITAHKCSVCGEELLWRKFSRVSDPQFRGNGFYKTDYGKGDK